MAYQSEYDGQSYDDPSQEEERRRQLASAFGTDPAPAAPADPRASGRVDYGNGVTGTRGADNLWYYPTLRKEGFQDVLGDNEVSGMQTENAFRQKAAQAGVRVDQGSGEISNLLAQHGGNMDAALASLQAPPSQYSASGGGASGVSAVSPFTSQLRDILMQQLGQASQPVSPNDPGVRDVLAGQRIATQRSAERQQGASAERLAGMGLTDSGAMETARSGIEQQRGEADAQHTGQVLSGELGQRRQQLQNLLSLALASGDNESARQIQMQLAQMQQGQFNDTTAYNYAALNSNQNLAALNAILGLGA